MPHHAKNHMSTKERLPFELDRANSKSLIGQMVDGIKAAVASGFYRSGAKLPSVRALAELAGVSLIVPRLAIRRLEREGVVITRPRIGTIVRANDEKVWRGRVLFVVPESDGNFMLNVVSGAIRNRMAVHGYHLERVAVPKRADGRYDFTFLDLAMRMRADLILVAYRRPDVIRRIRSLKVPFVVLGGIDGGPVKGAVGLIGMSSGVASCEFVRRCRIAGVKRVMKIGFCPKPASAMPSLFKEVGIVCETWIVRHRGDSRRHDLVGQSAAAAFERRLAAGRDWLPDVFYFDDDFVASGALTALSHHGIRVPEDVKVVSFANLGLGPIFYRRLTAFECDPFRFGESIASALLRFLEEGAWPGDLIFEERFVPGETFP